LAAAGLPLHANPITSAYADANIWVMYGGGRFTWNDSSSNPTGTVTATAGGAWAQATASATSGFLHGDALSTAGGGWFYGQAVADASYTTWVTFSGPPASYISVSLNLEVHGGLDTSGGGGALVTLATTMSGRSTWRGMEQCGSSPAGDSYDYDGSYGHPYSCIPYYNGQVFRRMPLDGSSFDTQNFSVPTNTPVAVELDLAVESIGNAHADFLHTAGFSLTGPAFNLPAGYTANSNDGLIVDNQFVGSEAPAAPEPASWALLATGLALAVTRYASRRPRSARCRG
jgi:hypothetical protein